MVETKWLAAAAAIVVGLAGSAALAEVTVECETVRVMIEDDEADRIREATGEEAFGQSVCDAATAIDVSEYTEPTEVEVTMSSGESYVVMLQTME
jgi:TRAP-type uncharacterized transport system substrate-binding protein